MHKLVGFLLILAVLLPGVLASDIAYIVKTPTPLNADEIAIKNSLTSQGYNVLVLDDSSMLNPNAYDAIIVGEDVSGISSLFDNKNYKTFFLSYNAAKAAGLSRNSGTTNNNKITISDNTNIITKQFSLGEKTLYNSLTTVNYLDECLALNSRSLAYKTDKYKSVLLILKEDSLLLNNGECSKRNVPIYERNLFFGLPKASSWNADAEDLFINSFDWLIFGEDTDGDGFYYDEECNDSNASIYPGAEEIPYNGIDENCDGYDLADTDKDGYCKQGYQIKNKALQCAKEAGTAGTDCDDNHSSINPGSSDAYKNCRNDAPIIEPIGKITIYETEKAIITVHAADPENDSITYNINDSRFSKNNNIFTWQTGYYDAGDYIFTITTSDGSLTSEKKVAVEVKEKNQAPNCTSIPALEWKEDEKASLNLSKYCSDADGDSLSYYIQGTSEYDYILLDSFEKGVANFSSKKDWNGQDWIIFKASDGKDFTLTNNVTLKVLPVNDAPILKKNIEAITWDEGKNLTNYLNLKNYLTDIDSNLSYSVSGNHFINIVINNGVASFYPATDWFGTENATFSASDGEFSVESNTVSLIVKQVNKPPRFSEMSCVKDIPEDTSYECELKASDFENDTLSFSVVSENNLDCTISGSAVKYISSKNYNGNASCKLKVSDNYGGYSEFILEVNVLPVNDAPVINDYFPAANPRIINNTNFTFSVSAHDVDSRPEITWFLDGNPASSGSTYVFNQPEGTYNVSAFVTDGLLNATQFWNVFVGKISDFTCSEMNGNICAENEICLGSILGVKDTGGCCSIPCSEKPPAFSDVEQCKNISSKIELKIEKPDAGDKFTIGDTIDIKAKVRNKAEDDLDFDVEYSLYDLTDDSSVEEDSDSLSVDQGDSESGEFEILVPQDLNEKHSYAVFVRALDDGGDYYCSQNYTKIKIEREKNDVSIKNFDLAPSASCGGYIDANIEVQNKGTSKEEVTLMIKSTELGIQEKSDTFKLEKYDKRDEAKRSLMIQIPQNATSGTYKFIASASYAEGDEEASAEKELLIECQAQEETAPETTAKSVPIKSETINSATSQGIQTEQKNKTIFLALSLITLIIAVIIIYLFSLIARRAD